MTRPLDIEAIHELAPQQEGMLFESLRNGGELFVEQEIHALPGTLDCGAFERTWAHLIQRHPMLRTAFVWKNRSRPLQVVFASVPPPIRIEDWRSRPPYQQTQLFEQHLVADRAQGFDLGVAPLLRVLLVRVSEQAYRMVWTQHHILFDGWSRAILLREFTTAYTALAQGGRPTEPVPPPYATYVEWLKRRDLGASESFWRRELDGRQRPTELGRPNRLAPLPSRERFGEIDLRLDAPEAQRIEACAKQQRVTLAALMHGAWGVVLSRCADDNDVLFGSTVSGRPADLPGAPDMIGLFVNTVPLRLQVEPAAAAWDWLRAVQARLLAMRDHEQCSAAQIHEWSGIPGSAPLYESVLVFENYPMPKPTGATPADRGRFIGARTTHALVLLASARQGLEMRAIFDTRRFARSEAARMLELLRALLRRLVSNSSCSVAALQAEIPDHAIPRVNPSPQQHARAGARPAHLAAGNPLEGKLLALAAEVLGVDDLGMADRFFDLGGHSLLAAQLLSRIDRAFRVKLPMATLFDSPDLRALAASIEKAVLDKVVGLSDDEARALIEGIG